MPTDDSPRAPSYEEAQRARPGRPGPDRVRWWPGQAEQAHDERLPGIALPATGTGARRAQRASNQRSSNPRSSSSYRDQRDRRDQRYERDRRDPSDRRTSRRMPPPPIARRRRIMAIGAMVLVLLAGAVAVGQLAGRDDPPEAAPTDQAEPMGRARSAERAEPASTAASGAGVIAAENAKPGSPEWLIPDGDVRPRSIEGFTDRVSAQQGDTVRLLVTTEAPSYEAIAYRLGFYDGVGARQIWTTGSLPGVAQPECMTDPDTRMVDCSNWSQSFDAPITADWVPGQYFFKLVPAEGTATFVPFVVRDDARPSDVLVISDVTTLQAYNTWGGYSLYTAVGGRPGGRATKVSFDRPMGMYWAQSGTLGDSYNIGQMVESLGLDVTYTTNIDQHQRPDLMKNHRVIVSGFHDEYYSLEMRNGLEAARDSGVNIVFLGANAVYRRIRLEPSPLGPDRHEVNYRSASADPLNGVDPERVTTAWREEPAARPESSLTGTYYECNEGGMEEDMVIVDGDAWMFEGTNVTSGQHWPDVVSEEYDRVDPDVPIPADIQVLAHSPLVCRGTPSFSDMAYYTLPGGAGVLNVGTLGFEPRLGPLCSPADLTPERWDCQLRQMMANVIIDFAKGPAATRHPARSNLAQLGIR